MKKCINDVVIYPTLATYDYLIFDKKLVATQLQLVHES